SKSESPYIHLRDRARALAAVPTWFTELSRPALKRAQKEWARGEIDTLFVFGALRMDLPFRAGVRLNPREVAALDARRKAWAKWHAAQKGSKKKKRKKKRGKGGQAAPPQDEEAPPQPPPPDRYEQATANQRKVIGLWREKLVAPGQWLLVYWNGFIALANPTRNMPPDAILLVGPKAVTRLAKSGNAAPGVAIQGDRVTFTIWAEEHIDPKKELPPDDNRGSDLWALCETLNPKWEGWPGRKRGKAAWKFEFTLDVEPGALARHNWKK
ncbi:MAG: hypothetical protein ACE5JG_08710, partial [Planctomycetota bacterium]